MPYSYSNLPLLSSSVGICIKRLEAAENLYRATLLRRSRDAELTETGDLHRRAAYALAKAEHMQEAVLTLERGRARGLSEALARDRADLEAIKARWPAVYAEFQEVSAALHELESIETVSETPPAVRPRFSYQGIRQRAEALHVRLGAAIDRIRANPGYEVFLRQSEFDDVVSAVDTDTPPIYLATTPAGSVALIVSRDNADSGIAVAPVWSHALTDSVLHGLLGSRREDVDSWFGAYRQWAQARNGPTRAHWHAVMEGTLQRLWDLLMGPVSEHLRQLGAHQALLVDNVSGSGVEGFDEEGHRVLDPCGAANTRQGERHDDRPYYGLAGVLGQVRPATGQRLSA